MPDLHHRSKRTNRGEEAGEEHTKVEIPTTCNHVFALTHYSVCKKIKVRKGEREKEKTCHYGPFSGTLNSRRVCVGAGHPSL